MNMIECIHTNSNCYKLKGGYNSVMVGYQPDYGKVYPMAPAGIIVHSTGANNTSLKRWVQPSKDDPNYNELIKKIGLNKNNNSWNRGVSKAVHYVIGKCADGTIATAHILPLDICAWGVGKGSKGSYNYKPAYIQFECCEDNLKNKEYLDAVIEEATDLCAYLCREYGWDANVILSHKEAHKKGYASNHADIDHWLAKFGYSMNDFRDKVTEKLTQKEVKPLAVGDKIDFVGTKQWSNSTKSALLYKKATACKATIKQIAVGKKHPYLIKGTGVYGWVNEEDVRRI